MQNENITIRAIILILFISTIAQGQGIRDKWREMPPTPEYFAIVMRMGVPTEPQFDTLWNVVQQYYGKNPDTSLLLAEHAVEITKNHKLKKLHGEALYLQGKVVIQNDPAAGLELLLSAREILKDEKEIDTRPIVEGFIGAYYARTNQYEKAIEHQLNALDLAKEKKDTFNFVKPLMEIGGIYFQMRNLDKAQEYLNEAKKMLATTDEEEPLPRILSNQSKIFVYIGSNYKAIADTVGTNAALYRDSAELYFRKGLEAANEGLSVAKKLNVPAYILAGTIALARVQNSMGDYRAAESSGKEALLMAENLGVPMYLADCHLSLSKSQRNLGLYADAMQHGQAGFAIVEKDPRAGKAELFEVELFEIYKAMGRTDLALPLLEKAMERLKDRIGMDTKKAIADAETKYQTAEKEKENLELAIANDRISKQRNLIMGGGMMLGLLGFFGYRLNKVNKDRNDKKAFAEALIFAQEEERKRIGRDLHDGIGQSLLLIKKQMDNTVGITLENQQMISATLEEVRSISQDLHPFQLDKFGLTATISDMVLKIEQSTDLFITREIEGIDKTLDPKSEIHLYRTIQEALSNIIKHAGATAAKVNIKNMVDKIQVSIMDNGKGFDLELAIVTSKSLGIRTMHERISAIGGKLKIEKGEASGTQVNISVPKSKII